MECDWLSFRGAKSQYCGAAPVLASEFAEPKRERGCVALIHTFEL